MESKQLLGKRIRQAREELGLSQEALGERLGCSQRTVSNIETGAVGVGVADLPHLARILQKNVFYFFPAQAEQLHSLEVQINALVQDEHTQALVQALSTMTREEQHTTLLFAQFVLSRRDGRGHSQAGGTGDTGCRPA